jgi:hypothetical protein
VAVDTPPLLPYWWASASPFFPAFQAPKYPTFPLALSKAAPLQVACTKAAVPSPWEFVSIAEPARVPFGENCAMKVSVNKSSLRYNFYVGNMALMVEHSLRVPFMTQPYHMADMLGTLVNQQGHVIERFDHAEVSAAELQMLRFCKSSAAKDSPRNCSIKEMVRVSHLLLRRSVDLLPIDSLLRACGINDFDEFLNQRPDVIGTVLTAVSTIQNVSIHASIQYDVCMC